MGFFRSIGSSILSKLGTHLSFVLDSRSPNKSRTSLILRAIEISSTGTATVFSIVKSLSYYRTHSIKIVLQSSCISRFLRGRTTRMDFFEERGFHARVAIVSDFFNSEPDCSNINKCSEDSSIIAEDSSIIIKKNNSTTLKKLFLKSFIF